MTEKWRWAVLVQESYGDFREFENISQAAQWAFDGCHPIARAIRFSGKEMEDCTAELIERIDDLELDAEEERMHQRTVCSQNKVL